MFKFLTGIGFGIVWSLLFYAGSVGAIVAPLAVVCGAFFFMVSLATAMKADEP